MKRLFQTSTESVWRHRDLRIAAPARALSILGDEIALVALMLHVHDLGAGARGVMLLLISAAVPTVLLAPLAGSLADRVDSRLLLVTASLLQVVVCVALAFTAPLWGVYLLVMALQAGQAVVNPTWQALVPRIVGEAELGQAMGATQALSTLAAVAGAPLGGLLSGLGGQRLPLLVDAGTFLALVAAALLVRTRRAGRHDAALRTADRPRALDGLRVIRADRLLWPIFVALFAYIVVGEATNVVEVFLIRDHLHGTSVQYGLVGAVTTAGIVVGSLLAGRIRRTPRRVVVVVVGAAVQSLALLLAGLVPSVLALAVVYSTLGVANGALNTSTGTLVFTRVPDAVRGRVGAALNGGSRACSIVALALGGLAGSELGAAPSFVLFGSLALVVVGWLALRVLPLRDVAPPEPAESTAPAERAPVGAANGS
ncbi:MFS transporter [Angustibacter luteus]|uniref:MFS transporter n=1 Tax=Angustibacter luteus TaxID=658456 RepID=A0ABW1JE52_9ACTN